MSIKLILKHNYEYDRVDAKAYVYLQRWLADWLMENNPNKPDVLGPDVVEPTDNYLYDDSAYSKDTFVSPDISRVSTYAKIPEPDKISQPKESEFTMSSTTLPSTDEQ